jgi:hypothetical protein
LHEAALAKRERRLSALGDKLDSVLSKQQALVLECGELEERLKTINAFKRFFQGARLRRRIAGMTDGNGALQEKVDELTKLREKIQSEALPEPEGLSLESRRLINCAIIGLAQHLCVHFSEHDLVSLTKTSTERPVGDMKFGDRRDCDRMVERIRERIEDMRQQATLADEVRRRTDYLVGQAQYRNETDAVPTAESVATIPLRLPDEGDEPARRTTDTPLGINVLLEEYWDLFASLC